LNQHTLRIEHSTTSTQPTHAAPASEQPCRDQADSSEDTDASTRSYAPRYSPLSSQVHPATDAANRCGQTRRTSTSATPRTAQVTEDSSTRGATVQPAAERPRRTEPAGPSRTLANGDGADTG